MSNCALRSFSQEDDSISSATSTTRGRRRFRRIRSSERVMQPPQQSNESSRQPNTERISTGLYEVSIRIKEDASRPPNNLISDESIYKQFNDTSINNERDDESSISSMSSYGDTTTNDSNKGEVVLRDDTTATDISSDGKKDKNEAIHHS
jgi:hypothetical protein